MWIDLSKYCLPQICQQTEQNMAANKEVFHVGPVQIAQPETSSLSEKIVNGISAVASFGLSRWIAKMVLPALTFSHDEKRFAQLRKENFLKLMPDSGHEFDLKMEDGAEINGMGIFQDKNEKKEFLEGNAQNQRWMIFFNGNMQLYENNLYDFQSTGKNLDVNMLVFNYRGVGDSKGYPWKTDDLIADGEACVKYLLSKGVPEANIYIDGFSLGGGVGTQVASLHEKIGLTNFCSFSSISKIASVIFNRPALANIVIALGWELDSIKAFEKIKAKKLIVYHPQDAAMPYETVCFYKMMKEHIKEQNPDAVYLGMHKGRLKSRLKEEFKPARVKLKREFSKRTMEAHCYDFKSDPAYPEIRNFVRDFFAK